MDDKCSAGSPDHSTARSRSLQEDIEREMQNVDAFFDEMISNDDYDCDGTRDRVPGGRCSGGSDVPGTSHAAVAVRRATSSAESVELMRENVELLDAFAANNETMVGLCASLRTAVETLKRTSRPAGGATTAVSRPHDDDADEDEDEDGFEAISEGAPRRDKDCCRSAEDRRAGRHQRSSCRGDVSTDEQDRFYGRSRSAAESDESVDACPGERRTNVPSSVSSKARAGQRSFGRDGFAVSTSSDASSADGPLPTSAQDFIVYDDDDEDDEDYDDDDEGDDEENSACGYDDSQDYADYWTNAADARRTKKKKKPLSCPYSKNDSM